MKPVSGIDVPLTEIEGAIAKTLARHPPQSWSYGAKVQLTLRDGRVLTYGPWRRPTSVERLRLALIKASRKHR